jgi:hypothetical protein
MNSSKRQELHPNAAAHTRCRCISLASHIGMRPLPQHLHRRCTCPYRTHTSYTLTYTPSYTLTCTPSHTLTCTPSCFTRIISNIQVLGGFVAGGLEEVGWGRRRIGGGRGQRGRSWPAWRKPRREVAGVEGRRRGGNREASGAGGRKT